MRLGFDVSKYQGERGAPIQALFDNGATFGIIRAGLGLEVDPALAVNAARLALSAHDGGYYWFLWPGVNPEKQADLFWASIKDVLRPRDGVAADVEHRGLTLSDVFRFGRRMRQHMGATRQNTLYTNYATWRALGNPDASGVFDDLWLAYYTLSHQPIKTADVSSVSFKVRGLAGFRKASLVQFGPLVYAGSRYDGDVYDDSLGPWRANLGDGRNPLPPLTDRPNYLKSYNAIVNAIINALPTVDTGFHGPAADLGEKDARDDVLAAVTELLTPPTPTP